MEGREITTNVSDIPGWGSDLDVKNRPAYPMWERPREGTGAHWKNPPIQEQKFTVYHSIERAGLTPVFGTSAPPRGLSGALRGVAYEYSEGSFGHWLTLLLADRINVIEGVFDDLLHGHIPNVFSEMGGKAEMKHNPKGFQKKVFMLSLIMLVVPAFLVFNNRRSRSEA